MYEKFFENLEAGWDGCTPLVNFQADVVEVTDPLAEELMEKLNIDKDKQFEKRTMSLLMMDGDGINVQGPTAYIKLAGELVDRGVVEGDKCDKAFFEKTEEDEEEEAGEEEEGEEGEEGAEGEEGEGEEEEAA